MTTAWQVTPDDVEIVLNQHGVNLSEEDVEQIADELFFEIEDQIIKGVLRLTDFDDQCNSMLEDIEDWLLEKRYIKGTKRYGV